MNTNEFIIEATARIERARKTSLRTIERSTDAEEVDAARQELVDFDKFMILLSNGHAEELNDIFRGATGLQTAIGFEQVGLTMQRAGL